MIDFIVKIHPNYKLAIEARFKSVKEEMLNEQMNNAELIETLQKLMRESDYFGCNTLIEQQSVKQKEHKHLLLLAVRVKRELGETDEERELLLKVTMLFPETVNAYFQLAKIECHARNYDLAFKYLDIAEALSADDYRVFQWRYIVARAADVDVEPHLVNLLAHQSEFNQNHFKELHTLLLKQNRNEEARQLLVQHEEVLSSSYFTLYEAIVDENEGNFELALSKVLKAREADSGNIDVSLRLIHIYTQFGDDELAVGLIGDLIDAGVADHRIYTQVIRLAVTRGPVFDKALDWAKNLPQNTTVEEQKAAQRLINFFDENNDEYLKQKLAKILESGAVFQRELIEDDGAELLISSVSGAKTVLLVFTGLANRVGISVKLLDAYLATLNVSVIYLRDNTRLLYNDGILSVAENYEGTLAVLKQKIESLKADKVISFGFSGGGFAAIRFGLDLDAKKVVGVNAVTNVCTDFMVADGRAKIIINRMNKYPERYRNLRILIEERSDYSGVIELYYSELVGHDALQSKNLEGLSNVNLFPLHGRKIHDVLKEFDDEEVLVPLLTRFLSI